MEAATVPQTEQKPEKFLVRNNTAGYIGVISIDHRGEEKGVNIEPNGARWMTEPEMLATARAPRNPADNPFEEQVFVRQNPETQRHEEYRLRPLTLESDATRFVPNNERYVPTADASSGGAREATQTPPTGAAPPSPGTQADPPPPPTPVASQDAPVPALRTTPATQGPSQPEGLSGNQGTGDGESWVQPPERPGEVLDGNLGGSDEPSPEEQRATASDAPSEGAPVAGQAQAAPQQPGAVEEEHAAVDPEVGEETGAAKPPKGEPVEGEFARAEEVGSPDAPAHDATEVGG